jgi:hypothetical protein
MNYIVNSFSSTFDKASKIEPLTLGVLKLASSSKSWGHTIRKSAVISIPIDHIVKVIAVPFIEIAEHFKDIINEKHLGMKILKSVITPIWLPIRVAVKIALFAFYFFTVGLELPYLRIKEIFRFEDPKNSYQESIDRMQKSFGIETINSAESAKSAWEDKFVKKDGDSEIDPLVLPIQRAFDRMTQCPRFDKVFVIVRGRGSCILIPELHPYQKIKTHSGIFSFDGPFNSHSELVMDNEKALIIAITANVDGYHPEMEKEKKCSYYQLTYEQYSKLPYEMPEDLLRILNSSGIEN